MSRSSSPSVQLFPFLAVLVCAMGALILLLLVTARRMQRVADARVVAEEAAEEKQRQSLIPETLPPSAGPELAPSGPTPEEQAAKEAERKSRLAARESRRVANAAARRRQSERDAKLQRQVAESEIARDQRRQTLEETTAELEGLRERLQATESSLLKLHQKKSTLKSMQDQDAKWLAQAEKEHAKLTESIGTAQKKLADLRRARSDAASKFAFIPYDGVSGTTRRPIYIECTSAGVRFQPENELLDESDLTGFTETYNPLLLASEKLMQYWREQSALTDDPRKPMRPYILLVVRSKGTVAYYVARKMLSQLGDDFGYELVEDDFPLQLPPADPEAKLVIRRAVAEALKNRGEMLALGGRGSEEHHGQVFMGRNEEMIEFGTLDDQLAVTEARQKSPFAKNTPMTGKGFSVTRSPVSADEMSSSGPKSAAQRRDPRRATGVPDNLGSVRDTVSDPGPQVPNSLAEMTRPPPGAGRGGRSGPGPVSLNPNSGQGRKAASDTYALSDPFSRENLATGRQGAGSGQTVDGASGDQAAGDSAGSGAPGNPAGTATGSRNSRGIPQGSRQGKVIDIPPDAAPISGAANPASPNGTSHRGTTAPERVQAESASSGFGHPDGQGTDGVGGDSRTGTRGQHPSGANPSPAFAKPPKGGSAGSDEIDSIADGNPNAAANGTGNTTANSRATGSPDRGGAYGKNNRIGNGNVTDYQQGPAGQTGSTQRPSGRQRGGPQVGSIDPNPDRRRTYGDNPEARQQLAAAAASKSASKAATVMQKRDSARRRWGGTNTGQIGFERKVQVQVLTDKIIIGKNEIEVLIEPNTTQEELVEAVLEGLDEHSQAWGKPPTRFYWVPYVNFEIYSGGAGNYERLNGALREWGVFSESAFKTGDKPETADKKDAGTVQPASGTDGKLIGPPEAPDKKTETGQSAAPKKSISSWFKRFTPTRIW